MSHLQYMPGDQRLVDQLVYELKSKGIFDQFRKECIADVDTRPAYQNLRQRVESSVSMFLSRQKWRPDLNKNQLREKLRKHILDGNYLEQGVERIVDQVVNPKVASCFIPQVEDLVYNYLGIPRKKSEPVAETSSEDKNDLLPKDLEAVSPGSVDEKDEKDVKMDIDRPEDIPIPEEMVEKVKEDSQMSGIIDLTSRDSEMSIDKSQIPLPAEGIKPENIPRPENSPPEMEVQKIELPKAPYPSTEIPLPDEIPPLNQEYFKLEGSDDESSSSDSSLIRNRMSPLTPVRTFDDENSCDAQQAFDVDAKDDKPAVSTFKFSIESEEKKDDLAYQFENQVSFNTPGYDDSSNSNNLHIDYESDANSKLTEKAAEVENSKDSVKDKDRKSSHKSSSRHSRDRHSSSSKRSDSKSSRDRRDSKTERKSEDDRKKSSKDDKKDRDSRESSKHRSSHKSSSKDKSKPSSSSSKHKTDDKKSSSSKSSSSRDKSKDSKSRSDKDRKSSSSSKKDDKKKEKKETDDHYSLSGRGNSNRRSTDRDSNDGNSSSSKSSNVNSSSKSEVKNGKTSSKSENTSSSEGTGNSPSDKEVIVNEAKLAKAIRVDSQLKVPIGDPKLKFLPEVVLKKPKFAANFEEAKKMMKMRKFIDDEQRRMNQEAALLLEFHANVRPSMSQAYSSISGPELEFACISNDVKDVETNEMIEDFVNNTTNESVVDVSFEEEEAVTEENIVEDLMEQNFEVTIIEEEISENEDQKSIYNQDLAMKADEEKSEGVKGDLQYFSGEELFDALQKNATYSDFYKRFTNKTTTKLFLINCTKYEEDAFKNVTEQEVVSYTRNGHLKKEVKQVEDFNKEVKLPEESTYTFFSPIKSECSFELSSDYDLKIEDMVKTTSRQQIMEIILGTAVDESPSKMPKIDYTNESSLESDGETCKRKFSEMESPDNNNRAVLTPNKIRKICDTEQISSTTEEDEVITTNHVTGTNVQRSKYLGKARRVGLPKPKRINLSNSPSSDKSVENYEQNAQVNGKVKTTPRNKVQRYDATDLYKPKLHFLSKRNNVS